MPDGFKGTTFYKMTGSGNDFVMLDGRKTPALALHAADVVALCDRRMGIGGDGLVVLSPEGPDRVRMDFWNCDGSKADMCGNAALCSTRLAAFLGLGSPEGMNLATGAGTFPTRCRNEADWAELHLPDFDLPAVPAGLEPEPGEGLGRLATVGVPHLVLEVPDLERADLMERGRRLRHDPRLGPPGANVNFVAPEPGSARWSLRTFERGVEGETLACGTGAVAAAVALAQTRKAQFPIQIATRSGRTLVITATVSGGRATDVWLAGEGRLVFTGVL